MIITRTGSIFSKDTPMPENITDPEGRLLLLPAAAYDSIPVESILQFCYRTGRHGLPTAELVAWLRDRIGRRATIEIGAGRGDLAFHLGIPATDSYCQTFPDVKEMYERLGQITIEYPPWVEKLEAAEAIIKYSPEIVLAQWVTHWIDPDLPLPPGGGSIYGVDENRIVESGMTYILIGNEAVHQKKKIMAIPHETHALPFLRSRASQPEADRVYIWN